mgnify:FL=1|jgi:hypothetical protein
MTIRRAIKIFLGGIIAICLSIFLLVSAFILKQYFAPTGFEMRSIEKGYMWGDRTNEGQTETFGFNLKERFDLKYLIGVEDGFVDRFSTHVFELSGNEIRSFQKVLKGNYNHSVDKNFSPLCRNNRWSENTVRESKIYKSEHCRENQSVVADCVVLPGELSSKVKICLFNRYVEISWGES